jgi:hypothetical protein
VVQPRVTASSKRNPLILGRTGLGGRVQPGDAIAGGTAAGVVRILEVAGPQQQSLSGCSPKLAAAGQRVLVSRVLEQGRVVAATGLTPLAPNVAPARHAAAAVVGVGWCHDQVAGIVFAEVRACPGGLAGCEGSVLGNRRGRGSGGGEEGGEEVEGEHICTSDL